MNTMNITHPDHGTQLRIYQFSELGQQSPRILSSGHQLAKKAQRTTSCHPTYITSLPEIGIGDHTTFSVLDSSSNLFLNRSLLKVIHVIFRRECSCRVLPQVIGIAIAHCRTEDVLDLVTELTIEPQNIGGDGKRLTQ